MTSNQQNPYNQQPMGQMMPKLQRHLSDNIVRLNIIRQERVLPNWLIRKSVVFFFIAFVACTIVWGYPMEMKFAILSSVSVLLFFYGGEAMSKSWAVNSQKTFLKNVFIAGFLIRLLWILFCYFYFNMENYHTLHGDDADTGWYMTYAKNIAGWIEGEKKLSFEELRIINGSAIDDLGYPVWLAIGYLLWGNYSDIFIPFIIKCIIGAYCALCIYRVSNRHFGEGTARMAAICVALNPNMIYWCGTMFKESEMMFLCCLCVDLVDRTLTSGKKLTFKSLLPGVAVGMYIFFFRSALGIVIVLSIFAHVVMASRRVMSFWKKVIAGAMVAIVLLFGMGDRLRTQAESIVESVQSDTQKRNMEWRSTRKDGGNSFAKYAGTAVFAPLIFTIPFPTFNLAESSQMLQRQLSGGNYIKNIFSFFVIWVMITMLLSGEWRKHVFILAYTNGYLASLVLSNFAHSSRFHMPIWPMLMLFAAYGIQMAKTNPKMRKWFPIVLVIEVVVCLGWNWFKLKGRGMI